MFNFRTLKFNTMVRTLFSMFFTLALVTALQAQSLKADATKSIVKWNAKKVSGEHYGKIALKSGELMLKDGKLTGGTFVIDMPSITCDDLTNAEYNQKLVGHLKNDDFFAVDKFPESKLVITSSTPFNGDKAQVKANLTIKGITKPVEFEASRKGKTYSATITVDRTLYDIRYGSGKFFESLGDNMIYDEFTIDVQLVVK